MALLTAAVESSKKILLRTLDQEMGEIHFQMKICAPLGRLKEIYAQRRGVAKEAFRFLFDGRRIDDADTPESLEMEDDDIIEVYLEQTGGYEFGR